MRPQIGQVINNKYRLNRLIGDGGMGSVYEARHERLGTLVALKFLHSELSRRTGLVQRFLQEAKVSAQIQSPHVVRVTDVDQTPDGQAFIVLEYLEGRTLQTLYEDLYKAGQRLSYTDALDYAMQMIEGVEAAHEAGIVHRDLKPDNVMITTGPKGAPLLKLLDFGIAKLKVTGEMEKGLTRPGVIMGTPEYMAPEQAYSADAVDSRADIFSLGVMMFEMLAGRRPVGGDEPQQIAAAYLAGQIARMEELVPGIAPELAAAVHKAMAALAKNRFASVSELRDAIEPFALAVRPISPSRASLSATPTPAPASPAAAGPATNLPQEAPRAVPKTLPPEDEPPPVHPSAATPIGGFAALNALGPVNMAATLPNPPLVGNGFGSTEFATPLTPLAPAAAMEAAPRPGGTHIGEGGGYSGSSATTAGTPAYGADFGGTAPMSSPFAAVQAMPGMRGPSGPIVSTLPTEPRRGESRGPSLVLVLLLALGVAGAVVGGVYAANQYAKVEDRNDAPIPIPIPLAAPVKSDPPPTAATTPTTATPPVAARPPPVITQPPPPKSTTTPPASTTAPPPPTAPTAPIIPSTLPFPFPTTFPFPNPFQPPGAQQQPAPTSPTSPTTPTSPPTSPTSPTTPTPTSTGRPKIIFGGGK